ncbi:DinB family protein [Deinococcus irradiatisoli]|uniref:DinB family protein n=1 Tax=Deinococcus irradiatisoli TaxID=2202254 RepID=A0A2Z3JB69_9DEIO|nr:DinB family protein [Deinococcus irradiatisoli]AWN22397.1 DinB family protein [Deinococcus irradiatisoli]
MSRSQHYLRSFQMHRAALEDLYRELPDEQGQFRAWEEGMSFIGLADHLAGAVERLPAMLRGEAPSPVEGSADLAAARQRLSRSGEQFAQTLAGLSDEALSGPVTAFGGRQMPVSAVLDFLISHEAHHKGQVWMMARMVGVKPPMFVKLG